MYYDSTYMRSQEQSRSETEGRITVAKGWGERGGGVTAEWVVSLWDDEKVLEMRGGDGCTSECP